MIAIRLSRIPGLLVGILLAGGTAPSYAGLPAGWQDKAKAAFEVYEDSAKEFRWRFKDTEGKILGTGGEGYKEKSDCLKAVDKIKADVKEDKATFEVYEDKGKEHRWRLKAKNGQTVASSSGGYKTKEECEKAIASLKKLIPEAEVKEEKK